MQVFGTEDMAITENFPPADEKRVYGGGSEGGGSGYWVEALGIDKPNKNGDGAGTTQISFKVLTGETSPSKKTSIRYFFNISEMKNGIDGLKEVRELYDQSSTEAGDEGADGIISGPFKYDKVPDTYYVEVTWDGYVIANSGKKYQFDLGMYYGDFWDPTNDWSYQGLKIGDSGDFFAVDDPPEERADHICIYADGVLVGGIEPDGTEPEKKDDPKTSTTTSTTTTTTGPKPTTTTTTTTIGPVDEITYGDTNCDGKVELADAILIMQALANPNKYGLGGKAEKPLTAQGKLNGDVDQSTKGLTSGDALRIQEYLLHKVASLDPTK